MPIPARRSSTQHPACRATPDATSQVNPTPEWTLAYLLGKKMETLPDFLRNSVTWDQGKEMARHADLTVATGIPVYLCDPVRHVAPCCIPG
jgi:hypothetical protein